MLTINNTLDGFLKNVEIKGNTIQDENDLSIISSVGDKVEGQELYEIPLLCVGENICGSNIELGGINSNGQLYSSNAEFRTVDYTQVDSSKVISTSVNSDILLTNMVLEYDANYNLIRQSTGIVNVSLSPNCKYVKLRGRHKTNGTDISAIINDKIKCQIEYSSVATSFKLYKSHELTILSPVQLEKVGDVADRIICRGGVWGVWDYSKDAIFDGSESWTWSTVTDVNTVRVQLKLNDVNSPSSSIVKCMSKDFQSRSADDMWGVDNEAISINEPGSMTVRISKDKATSLQEAKDYFRLNNLHVKYPTNEPTFIPLPHDQQIKLRTFATKTNISFLTEIEGTIKGEVAKSLGATVNTHTVEINNIYDELERVKKLEESTVSTVTNDGKDFVSVEATNSGYFEDILVQGRTFVNKFVELKGDDSTYYSITNGVIKRKSTDYRDWVNITDYVSSLALGEHTIIAYVSGDSTSNGFSYSTRVDGTGTTSKSNGVYVIGYKNPAFKFKLNNADVSLKLLILEGDHTQAPPTQYFEGLASVGEGTDEIVVSSMNKNLLKVNVSDFTASGITCTRHNDKIILNGTCTEKLTIRLNTSRYTSTDNLINLLPGETYTLSTNYNKDRCNIMQNGTYTVVMSKVSSVQSVTSTITQDLSKNLFVYIIIEKGLSFNNDEYWFMLEKSSTHTSYEQQKTDEKRILRYNTETNTWEKPILREWDVVEKKDGKYWNRERSGQVVLDGSENWTLNGTHSKFMDFTSSKLNISGNMCISCILPYNIDIATSNLKNKIGVRPIENGIRIKPLDKDDMTLEEGKAWLQANPVTVVYQLATEKVYECTNIDLITYPNDTNLTVKSGALCPNIEAKVHASIANIVNLLQKKVSVLESNITQYMVTQNRIMLTSRYGADSVTFKVDYPTMMTGVEDIYDEDLFGLLRDNVIVGIENYDYDKMIEMMNFYVTVKLISWDMWDELFEIIDLQHFPPTEEAPVI